MQRTLRSNDPPFAAPLIGGTDVAASLSAEVLCERYAERVFRFAAMVSRGEVEAEDLAQDALERAIRRLSSFDPNRGTVEGWLWRIVANAARDAGRLIRRRELLMEKLRRFRPIEEAAAEFTIRDSVEDGDLLAAVRRLRPRDRSIIALRYGAELSYIEIGAALGITPATAGVAGRRALGRLRHDLLKQRTAK